MKIQGRDFSILACFVTVVYLLQCINEYQHYADTQDCAWQSRDIRPRLRRRRIELRGSEAAKASTWWLPTPIIAVYDLPLSNDVSRGPLIKIPKDP